MKKIVVIGPESTGKSTLCESLAKHFKTIWCPEFARSYLTEHGMDYCYDDLITIAKGQLQLEDEYASSIVNRESSITKPTNSQLLIDDSLLFIDTDMYVMKVWCEYVFGKCHQFILDTIIERKYDLYLLCNTDLPWSPDPLREYPDEARRIELFNIYKDILINQSTPWIEIKGKNEERLQIAISAVDNLLNKELKHKSATQEK